MAHRQGLDDSSTNIHGGAVRVGRVLEGALARAAVRNGRSSTSMRTPEPFCCKRSVQIAPAKALADWRNPVGGGEQRTIFFFLFDCTRPKIFLTHELPPTHELTRN